MRDRPGSFVTRNLPYLFLLSGCIIACSQPAAAQAVDLRRGVDSLALGIAERVPERQVLKVAVADFTDLQGIVSDLGRFVAERLTTRLSRLPEKFRVIERRRLISVVEELKLNMSDLIDPEQVRQVGRMAGVDALVTGTLSDLGTVVEIDARVILIETLDVLPGVSVGVGKDEVVADMLQRGRTAVAVRGAPPVGPEAVMTTVDAWGLRLRALGCKRDTDRLVCTVSIENLQAEQRRLIVRGSYSSTYVTDNLGNQYSASVGTQRARTGSSADLRLLPGVVVNVHFVAEGVSSEASHMTVVIQAGDQSGLFDELVALRNIPIETR